MSARHVKNFDLLPRLIRAGRTSRANARETLSVRRPGDRPKVLMAPVHNLAGVRACLAKIGKRNHECREDDRQRFRTVETQHLKKC